MDIKILHSEGHSIRAIARKSGLSRNTVRSILRNEHSRQKPVKADRKAHPSKMDAFKDYCKDRYLRYELSAVRLLEEINKMGYSGSINTLRRYLACLKPDIKHQKKLTVRFESQPGQQAQVDWAYCGRFACGDCTVGVYMFVMVLSFSRMLFVCFTNDMKLPTLIDCHQKAFAYFEGWPRSILYDNMKQVKLSPWCWNKLCMDFCQHYDIAPKTHRAYRPRTKGKVERMVDYIKDNFLCARTFDGMQSLNVQALQWMEKTANPRVHATTGKPPVQLFAQEKSALRHLSSIEVYQYQTSVSRKVNAEAMIHFERCTYSVPPQYSGQLVEVVKTNHKILIRKGSAILSEHKASCEPGRSVVDPVHLRELWKISLEQTPLKTEYPKWQVQFSDHVQQVNLESFAEVLS